MRTNVKLLDGKWLAGLVRSELAAKVASSLLTHNRPPGLGVLLIGDDPASHSYVASKEKVAEQCGFATFDKRLPKTASYQQVQEAIAEFNADKRVDGILLQLPLPGSLPVSRLIDEISPEKDADCLHPLNQGRLMRAEGTLRPCTPLGILWLIDLALSDLEVGAGSVSTQAMTPSSLAGKNAVVIGRSILVGKPAALMLMERNATVCVAHSKTRDLAAVTRSADILVAAVGVPRLVKGDWVKEGAIVIDVGTSRLADGKLCGDVDFEQVMPRCSAITPVPGGVGPMTVAMLMRNTFELYCAHFDIRS